MTNLKSLFSKTNKDVSRTTDKDIPRHVQVAPMMPSLSPMPSVMPSAFSSFPIPAMSALNPFNNRGFDDLSSQTITITEERRKFLENVKVEDIHNEFFLAQETLLKEAEEHINANNNEEELLYAKLYNLGFYRHKKAGEGMVKENIVKQNKSIHDTIISYKRKYPLYKFITEEKIVEICKKYELVIGTPDIFIGEIPKKNLLEIVNCNIKKEDIIMGNFSMGYQIATHITQVDVEKAVFESTTLTDEMKEFILGSLEKGIVPYIAVPFSVKSVQIQSLSFPRFKICATPNNFDMSNARVEGLQIIDNDPIVLYPVERGYLVISCWGAEASDENVANEINN